MKSKLSKSSKQQNKSVNSSGIQTRQRNSSQMYGSTNGKESSKIKKKNSKNDDYLASYSTKNKNVKEHMKPATRQQYRKYLDDSENTFYENSYNGIVLSVISCVRPLLISSFSFLILFYGVLSFVQPYSGICPRNADCGVYIHCQPGYQLSPKNECQISQQTKREGRLICEAVVQNLKLKYGNHECENKDGLPFIEIRQVYKMFEVETNALKKEMMSWFEDKKNQQRHKFNYYKQSIRPNERVYSLSCKLSILIESRHFKMYLGLFLMSLLGVVLGVRMIRRKIRAKSIYSDLKQYIKKEGGDIAIDPVMLKDRYGFINEQLWQLIDKIRSKDGQIVYYEVEMLHWRMIG